MKKGSGMLLISAFTAAGSAIGTRAKPKKPLCGGLIGAAAGMAAGFILKTIYDKNREDGGKIKYYTKSSPLYDNSEEVGYI